MILAVDSSALVLLLNPAANPPDDPSTGEPVKSAQARVEHFLATLQPSDTIVVPAPVMAEVMVRAGDGGPALLELLNSQARIKVRPYGLRAAVETALMTRAAIDSGDKRGGSNETWQKVKVDRQICATARVERADRIYADDGGLIAFARRIGMDVFSTWDLDVPEEARNLFTLAGLTPEGSGSAEESVVVSILARRAIDLGDDNDADAAG